MIDLKDIQTAITKVLTDNGNTVTANEIQEGFDKPTFFINLFTNSTEVQNQYTELVNVGVELKYIPAVETREDCIEKSEHIKQMFLNTPLPVSDRFLSITDITFDMDNSNLIIYFEIQFLQGRTTKHKQYEKSEKLMIGGLEHYGTSTDSN